MNEDGNKNPRTMHKASAKALPLPLDLVALSSSSDRDDEYQPGHRWICAVYLLVRHTGVEQELGGSDWRLAHRCVGGSCSLALGWGAGAMMRNSSPKEEKDTVKYVLCKQLFQTRECKFVQNFVNTRGSDT
jgi:hypothetical protein